MARPDLMDRDYKKRAKVLISGSALVELFKQDGKTRCFKVDQGFPMDSLLIGAIFDASRDIWEVAVTSEEFDVVEDYEVLPELPVLTTTSVYGHDHED